jgi:hypothetical protein
MTTTYAGCSFRRTNTTTDVRRVAFGRSYQTIAQVWEVEGRISKPAGRRPFLTSAAACREYVRGIDTLAAEASTPAEYEQPASEPVGSEGYDHP